MQGRAKCLEALKARSAPPNRRSRHGRPDRYGEIQDITPTETPAAALGRKGGQVRAAKLSAKKRREIAVKADNWTPSTQMAAGLTDKLLSMADFAEMVDASLPKPGKRCP